jgi:hypothetical protein
MKDSSDNSFYTVDTFTGSISVTIGFGSITASVTPASRVAYDTTSYKFDITPAHYIP